MVTLWIRQGEITISIELDTTDTAALQASYFFNGVQQGATQTLPAAAFGNIDFVGISSDGSFADGTASFSSFSLTSVPEPSSVMFLALGSIGLITRRRRS